MPEGSDVTKPPADPARNPRVRVRSFETLWAGWSTLRRVVFDYRDDDGEWAEQVRETYDRGNGVTILLRDPDRGTVLLTRQFRVPAYLNGHADGMMVETPAGVLDRTPRPGCAARSRRRRDTRVGSLRRLYELFMTPGSVSEHITFFAGTYSATDRVSAGGGVASEGEEIEVIEVALSEALAMVERGEIVDAKTVLLLQNARLELAGGCRRTTPTDAHEGERSVGHRRVRLRPAGRPQARHSRRGRSCSWARVAPPSSPRSSAKGRPR